MSSVTPVLALAAPQLVEAVGWSVVHFVWQGAAIAAIAAIALALMKRRSAEARYCVCAAALATMFLAKAATLVALVQAGADVGPAGFRSAILGSRHATTIEPGFAGVLPWVAYLWIAGMTWQSSRTGWQWYRIQRLVRLAPRELVEPWRRIVPNLARRVGVRVAVRVVETARVTVPATVGWLRPVLLLPVGLTTGLTQDQIELVIAHELAHIRRADFFVNLLQSLIDAVLFYHPLVWWLSGRMRAEREFCCDDLVVRTRGNAIGYARALTELESFRRRALSLSMAANGGSLMTRIQRIVSTNPAPSQLRPGWLASVLLLGGLVGATSITAYGLSIREIDEPPAGAVVVSDGPTVATLSAGAVYSGPASAAADVTDSAQELLRIKRARLQKLMKEIAELEEQCGEPSVAQVTRASGPTAATVAARPQPSADQGAFRGVVVNRFGRPSEVAELPAEDAGIRLDVKPVIKDGGIIELSVEPVAIATGVGATTKVLATHERSVPEALRALGYLSGPAAVTENSDAQETLRALGYVSGQAVTENDSDAQETLRALGYLSGEAETGPDEIATVVRTTTTTTNSSSPGTAAVASPPRLDKKDRVAGQVTSTESKSDNAEIQRLSDEIDVLKKRIMDLNKKLDGKGKTD